MPVFFQSIMIFRNKIKKRQPSFAIYSLSVLRGQLRTWLQTVECCIRDSGYITIYMLWVVQIEYKKNITDPKPQLLAVNNVTNDFWK